MNNEPAGKSFLEEFRAFMEFIQRLWGILAGISVLFPLSNALAKVVPLAKWDQGGGFAYLPPELVTTATTLMSLFVMFSIFGQRHTFRTFRTRQPLQRKARLSFGVGFLALIGYLVASFAIADNFYFGALGWESSDPRRLVGDVALLLLYSSFFVLVTQAFVLLGLVEFLRLAE